MNAFSCFLLLNTSKTIIWYSHALTPCPPLPLHTVYPYRIHKVRICLILGKLLRAPMPIAHLFFGLCHIVYITHVIYAICLWGLFLGVPLITFGSCGAWYIIPFFIDLYVVTTEVVNSALFSACTLQSLRVFYAFVRLLIFGERLFPLCSCMCFNTRCDKLSFFSFFFFEV